MRQVTREEYHAFLSQFQSRQTARVGICEPPVELSRCGGEIIGRIKLYEVFGKPNQYFVANPSIARRDISARVEAA